MRNTRIDRTMLPHRLQRDHQTKSEAYQRATRTEGGRGPTQERVPRRLRGKKLRAVMHPRQMGCLRTSLRNESNSRKAVSGTCQVRLHACTLACPSADFDSIRRSCLPRVIYRFVRQLRSTIMHATRFSIFADPLQSGRPRWSLPKSIYHTLSPTRGGQVFPSGGAP